ncbi:hypothetical protein PR003_g21911 [Phytophthora rubi]|uniref:Uncharacterized protein n=2 Tax=Phytophthora TaxID=4783 RepID=A0A6A4D9A5_9STRA|nr:hypothetical protein PR002_g21243 [Phytophthora rubi]KAE9303816.1 hypothetical protein PR003_g21911 [Phytophthora rubi]
MRSCRSLICCAVATAVGPVWLDSSRCRLGRTCTRRHVWRQMALRCLQYSAAPQDDTLYM